MFATVLSCVPAKKPNQRKTFLQKENAAIQGGEF